LGWDDEDEIKKDRLYRDYDTILKESAVLTTFSGVLFGFLLNISIRGANQLLFVEKIILVLASFSVAIAISLFVMPVIYHHVEFPYTDVDKFKKRSHRFILFGFIPTGVVSDTWRVERRFNSVPLLACFIIQLYNHPQLYTFRLVVPVGLYSHIMK